MAITFDRINKWIYITAPQTSVMIQDLIDAIRDYEDNDASMDLSSLNTGMYIVVIEVLRNGALKKREVKQIILNK